MNKTMIHYLKPLLCISLIIPFFQGVQYALIGSIYPLVIVSLISCPVIFLIIIRRDYTQRMIKYWGYLNLCYGSLGFLLIGLGLLAGGGLPSSIYYQFNLWYILKLGLCIIIGIILLKIRKERMINHEVVK